MRLPIVSMLKSTAFALSMLTVLLVPSLVLAEPPLRIATEGAYPPFSYIDEEGNLAGFDVDIGLALCEELNRQCEIRAVPWDDLLPGLSEDKYDVIIASMARTPEREQVADFTGFYYRSRSMFVGKSSMKFVQTRTGMEGLSIAVQAGTVQEHYLLTHFGGAVHINSTQTTDQAFELLIQGEVDAVLSVGLSLFQFLQKEAGQPFDFIGNPLPESDPSSKACMAVRKGNKTLVESLNRAVKGIRLNGVYEKINAKYFPFSIY